MFKIVNVQIDPILLETHFRKLATKDSNPPTKTLFVLKTNFDIVYLCILAAK